MTPDNPAPDTLRLLEISLYKQLLVLAIVSGLMGLGLGGPSWGLAAALGPLAAIAYYVLLAVQMRRVFAKGLKPAVGLVVLSLAGRQIICLAVPALCFFWLGQPWLACLLTLVVARHWILVAAWPRQLSVATA